MLNTEMEKRIAVLVLEMYVEEVYVLVKCLFRDWLKKFMVPLTKY